MADEVREVPGAVRVRYLGLKSYGWFWKRQQLATWCVEVFETWNSPDPEDWTNYKGWVKKFETTNLLQANAEAARWKANPEFEVVIP